MIRREFGDAPSNEISEWFTPEGGYITSPSQRELFSATVAISQFAVCESQFMLAGGAAPVSSLPPSRVQSIDPKLIRFSQDSVSDVGEITASMKSSGWDGAPIQAVKMSDGTLTTFDSTRLLAASRAGIDAQVVVRRANETFPGGRWISKKGITPKTWEEAVKLRIREQSSRFRRKHPNGSPFTRSNE